VSLKGSLDPGKRVDFSVFFSLSTCVCAPFLSPFLRIHSPFLLLCADCFVLAFFKFSGVFCARTPEGMSLFHPSLSCFAVKESSTQSLTPLFSPCFLFHYPPLTLVSPASFLSDEDFPFGFCGGGCAQLCLLFGCTFRSPSVDVHALNVPYPVLSISFSFAFHRPPPGLLYPPPSPPPPLFRVFLKLKRPSTTSPLLPHDV